MLEIKNISIFRPLIRSNRINQLSITASTAFNQRFYTARGAVLLLSIFVCFSNYLFFPSLLLSVSFSLSIFISLSFLFLSFSVFPFSSLLLSLYSTLCLGKPIAIKLMSSQVRAIESSPAMTPSTDEPERFPHNKNINRLFNTATYRNHSASAARGRAASLP